MIKYENPEKMSPIQHLKHVIDQLRQSLSYISIVVFTVIIISLTLKMVSE